MRFSPSNHHDRDSLLPEIKPGPSDLALAITGRVPLRLVTPQARELVYDFTGGYDAADDMAEWAVRNADKLRVGRVPARTYRIADEQNAQRLRESAQHFAHRDLPEPDRCTWCNPAGCHWPQCTTAGDSTPTVPTRRVRRLPRLSWWRRLLLALWPAR